MTFQGQVALVVGGARGIGFATVRELLREGANVAVSDVSAEGEELVKGLQEEFGAERTFFVRADVRDDAQLEAAFTKTKSQFKHLNILVNCAGIVNDIDWNREVDINMKGTIRGTLLAWKFMSKDEGGSGGIVVNISSIAAVMPSPVFPIYTATKLGVIGLGRACGSEYHVNRTGVKVMTVCPGQTDTPLFDELFPLKPEFNEELQKWTTTLPMQTADDAARAIVQAINSGVSGSVWMSEDGKPAYQLIYPKYADMRLAE